MMNPEIIRAIIENVARCRLALRRDELSPALRLVSKALSDHGDLKVLGPRRFEMETLFGEILADLNAHPGMQRLLTPPGSDKPASLKFIRGKSKTLAALLSGLADRLDSEADQRALEKQKVRETRKKDLISKARSQLADGDLTTARAFIQKVLEEFGAEDPKLPLQMAQLMCDVGMILDAAEILRAAVDIFPKDAKMYALLVSCYSKAKEYAKAEEIYIRMFRQFGMQPQLVCGLARIYIAWKRYRAAEQRLTGLLMTHPNYEEATTLLELVKEKRAKEEGPE